MFKNFIVNHYTNYLHEYTKNKDPFKVSLYWIFAFFKVVFTFSNLIFGFFLIGKLILQQQLINSELLIAYAITLSVMTILMYYFLFQLYDLPKQKTDHKLSNIKKQSNSRLVYMGSVMFVVVILYISGIFNPIQ